MKLNEFQDNDIYVFHKDNGGVTLNVREINKKYVTDIVCDTQGNIKSVAENGFSKTKHESQYMYTKDEVKKLINSWLTREGLK